MTVELWTSTWLTAEVLLSSHPLIRIRFLEQQEWGENQLPRRIRAWTFSRIEDQWDLETVATSLVIQAMTMEQPYLAQQDLAKIIEEATEESQLLANLNNSWVKAVAMPIKALKGTQYPALKETTSLVQEMTLSSIKTVAS